MEKYKEMGKTVDSSLRAEAILKSDSDQTCAGREKKMLSIGEFSKICQVTVKTLRHYDRIGLLKPVYVDDMTGYRYYSRGQMEKMLLIQRLKRYGFSLEEISSILHCTEKGAFLFKMLQQKDRLKQQKQDMELAISELTAHMQSYERTGDLMDYQRGYKIDLKEAPERNVIACRQKMGVDEFGKYYSTLYERVPKERVTPNGVTGAVYYDKEFDRENSDIELIVGIREREKADRVMKAGLCAMTVHKGPYSSLSEAYGALVDWIAENGYEWNGVPYEIYTKTQFDSLAPQDWETEVYFPVRKK